MFHTRLFSYKQRYIIGIYCINLTPRKHLLIRNNFSTLSNIHNPRIIFNNDRNLKFETNHRVQIILCGIQFRNSSDLQPQKPEVKSNDPSSNVQLSVSEIKKNVEYYTYRILAKTIDIVKLIWKSNELKSVKTTALNLVIGLKEMFNKNVLGNPKIKSLIDNFQKKLDEARQHDHQQQDKK